MIFHNSIKKDIFVTFATFALCATTANSAETRYKDRMFTVEKTKDIAFAADVPHLNSPHPLMDMIYSSTGEYIYFYTSETDVANKPLLLDLYTPKGDTETNRAVVIVSHGGSMVAGAKDDTDQQTVNFCDSLAARGFVTASIQYRRGVTVSGATTDLSIDSVNFARTVYRGVQDIGAAVRYMRKNASTLGIDPNRIYLMGNSAGAILSLENIYAKTEADFPSYIKKEGAPELGVIDLYGEQGFDAHANGVVALWGGIHNPNLIGNNNTPVFLAHGTADATVLFKTGRPLSGGISMNGMKLNVETPTLYGSFVIDSILTAQNIEHESYFVEGVKHEFYDKDEYETPVKEKVFNFLYKLASSTGTTAIKSRTFALAHHSAIQMDHGNLRFSVSRGNNLNYSVVDLRGRSTLIGRVSAGESVDLSSLRNGVYMLKVQGEKVIRFSVNK